MNSMTLEEAQAEILKLKEDVTALTKDKELLNEEKKKSDQRITDLQEHNQKLFLKVTTQIEDPKKKEEDKPVQTPEEFAKTIKLKGGKLINE